MLRGRRPSVEELEALAASVGTDSLTYDAVGATADQDWPPGYRHDRCSIDIGPADLFEAAAEELRRWQPHRGGEISVGLDRPMAVGANVALAAPLPLGFVVATCRVVYVHDNEDCFAWAYGTLPQHPETGEERFAVVVKDGRTLFEIGAFSRPRHWLARAAGPIARRLQLRATSGYLDAMKPGRW